MNLSPWDNQRYLVGRMAEVESGSYDVCMKNTTVDPVKVFGTCVGILVGERGSGKKAVCLTASETLPPPRRRFVSEFGTSVFIEDKLHPQLPTLVVSRSPEKWATIARRHTTAKVCVYDSLIDAAGAPPGCIAVVPPQCISSIRCKNRLFIRAFLYDTTISVEHAVSISDRISYFTWIVHHDHMHVNVDAKYSLSYEFGCSRSKIERLVGFLTIVGNADSAPLKRIRQKIESHTCRETRRCIHARSLRDSSTASDLHGMGMTVVSREGLLEHSRGRVRDRIASSLDDACPVCMSSMDQCIVLPGCNHVFCTGCCLRWWRVQNTISCPTCRKDTCRSDLSSYKVVVLSGKGADMVTGDNSLRSLIRSHDTVVVEKGLKTRVARMCSVKSIGCFSYDRDAVEHIHDVATTSIKTDVRMTLVGSSQWIREIVRQTRNMLHTEDRSLDLKCITYE